MTVVDIGFSSTKIATFRRDANLLSKDGPDTRTIKSLTPFPVTGEVLVHFLCSVFEQEEGGNFDILSTVLSGPSDFQIGQLPERIY